MWLHSSVGRASHRYRGGHGFESSWSLDFFRLLLSNCLNWKIYCDDHSSLWSTTAVQIYELFHIYFISKITQFRPQFFSVNGSIICSTFDVNGSIIFGGLHFWRHWFNMAKILSKFGEQHLVMVNYACSFNQSETGKYFEWIIIVDIYQAAKRRG